MCFLYMKEFHLLLLGEESDFHCVQLLLTSSEIRVLSIASNFGCFLFFVFQVSLCSSIDYHNVILLSIVFVLIL